MLKPLMDEIEANKIDERIFASEGFVSARDKNEVISQDSISLDLAESTDARKTGQNKMPPRTEVSSEESLTNHYLQKGGTERLEKAPKGHISTPIVDRTA